MSANKTTVQRYVDGFNAADHERILSCFTDDIVWEAHGLFRYEGKEAFDKVRSDAFEIHPVITVARMVEEGGVVILEGSVKGDDGVTLVFCDVCELRDGKIATMTAYIARA